MSDAEHEPMDETAYLLRSSENARRILASIEELEAGQGTPRELVERHRVQFPLIHNGHPASPEEELTPERVAQILLDQEARWASET